MSNWPLLYCTDPNIVSTTHHMFVTYQSLYDKRRLSCIAISAALRPSVFSTHWTIHWATYYPTNWTIAWTTHFPTNWSTHFPTNGHHHLLLAHIDRNEHITVLLDHNDHSHYCHTKTLLQHSTRPPI
jgi:hypothetical protein